MKIIKNINKNKSISPISEQDREIILENAANTFSLKWQREGQRRHQQSTADILKAMQKVKLMPALEPVVAMTHEALLVSQAKVSVLQEAVIVSPQPTFKPVPNAFQVEEQRMKELKAEREQQRRDEQSATDKENAAQKAQSMLKLMPKAKVVKEDVVVMPKRKAKAGLEEVVASIPAHRKVLGFFEAQAQQIRAIKLDRELQRRLEQSQQDKKSTAQKRARR